MFPLEVFISDLYSICIIIHFELKSEIKHLCVLKSVSDMFYMCETYSSKKTLDFAEHSSGVLTSSDQRGENINCLYRTVFHVLIFL